MPSISQRAYRVGDPCVYCGGISTTRDHVIPRSLVPRENRAGIQWLLVPACAGCNSLAKSGRDTALRDMLAIDHRTASHPAYTDVTEGPFYRALVKGHPVVPKEFFSGFYVPITNEAGDLTEIGWIFRMDPGLPTDALNWITRGLIWNAVGACPSAAETRSKFIASDSSRKFDYWLYTVKAPGHSYMLGDTYTGVVIPMDPRGFFVVHLFLGQIFGVSLSGLEEFPPYFPKV